MTIDDPAEVAALFQALETVIPFRMFLGSGLRLTLKRDGLDLPAETPVVVEHVFYMGDEGGVMCGLRARSGDDAVVVSLTHLVPVPGDPLATRIAEYQRRRVAGIAKQNARGAGGRGRGRAKRR